MPKSKQGGGEGLPRLLRRARERARLTPAQVAKELGIRRPAIYEMEKGTRRVSADELGTLSDIYNVNADWLLERAKSRPRDDRPELAAQALASMSRADLERLERAIRIIKEPRSPTVHMPG